MAATSRAARRRRECDGEGVPIPRHIERELRGYLECGILACGFARARCANCGHDFLVAFSCKGRGMCPSCTTRRMAETTAHLVEHVFPRVPVRQWVIAFPRRLRYFFRRDPVLLGAVRLALRGGPPYSLRRRCDERIPSRLASRLTSQTIPNKHSFDGTY